MYYTDKNLQMQVLGDECLDLAWRGSELGLDAWIRRYRARITRYLDKKYSK